MNAGGRDFGACRGNHTGDWCLPGAGAISRGLHKIGASGCLPENPAPFRELNKDARSLRGPESRRVFPLHYVRAGCRDATSSLFRVGGSFPSPIPIARYSTSSQRIANVYQNTTKKCNHVVYIFKYTHSLPPTKPHAAGTRA